MRNRSNITMKDAASAIRQLQSDLEAAKEKYRLLSAQHSRLCDEVYEEDGETLKIVAERAAHDATEQRLEQTVAQLNHETMAHDDLKRSILDGSHPNLVLERKAREEAEQHPWRAALEGTVLIQQQKLEAAESRLAATDDALRLEGMEQAAKFLDKYCWVVARDALRDEINRLKGG